MNAPSTVQLDARFRVSDGAGRHPAGANVVRLNHEIAVQADLLSEYCFTNPDALTHDLMTLIGAVKYADRVAMRWHSRAWGRSLQLELPVYHPSLWKSRLVSDALTHCLNYLTSDTWTISFRQRRGEPKGLVQPTLSSIQLGQVSRVFVPFSHGLDSFAQVRLLQHRDPNTDIVCVRAAARASNAGLKAARNRASIDNVRVIPVPVVVHLPHHKESSFRTRPFMYYLLAAFGAIKAGGGKVLIPENGQGSLGGSLVWTGQEARHRSCYPGFTKRLGDFVCALTGHAIEFYHPALFDTKGQVLQALQEAGEPLQKVLTEHQSCSCDARLSSRNAHHIHCGICGNCLLRRISERFAGMQDGTEYLFANLGSDTLRGALEQGDSPKLRFFGDLARNSIRDMERLAVLGRKPDDLSVRSAALDVARYIGDGASDTHGRLAALLRQHTIEWDDFLASCGGASWIYQIARG
jgi:hypothetical protein